MTRSPTSPALRAPSQRRPPPFEGEPSDVFGHFSRLAMTPPAKRNLTALADEIGVARKTIGRWSKRYEWPRRLEEFDRSTVEQAVEARHKATTELEAERIKEILRYDAATTALHSAALRAATQLYAKILPAIENIKPEKLSAGDVAKLTTAAARLADVAMTSLGEHYGIQDYLLFIEKASAARQEARRDVEEVSGADQEEGRDE